MKQLKSALEARQADIKTKSAAAQQSEEQVKRLEQMLRESQVATDRVQKEFNLLNEKVQKLHHDLEDQIHTNTQLLAENSQKAVELKQKEEEILQVKVGLASCFTVCLCMDHHWSHMSSRPTVIYGSWQAICWAVWQHQLMCCAIFACHCPCIG